VGVGCGYFRTYEAIFYMYKTMAMWLCSQDNARRS
jgi:hypothetical protein